MQGVTDVTRTSPRSVVFTVLYRVVASAVVGFGLVMAWASAYQNGVLNDWLNETDMSEFVLLVLVALPIALVLSVLLAGPVLWLVRVRPVWPIVVLGPFVVAVAHWFRLHESLRDVVGNKWVASALVAAAGYALAALLTSYKIKRS